MTKIKRNGEWKNTTGHATPMPGTRQLLWQGPNKANYVAGNNVLGSFVLPKGKWVLDIHLYTIASWFRVGHSVGGTDILDGRSYNQNDVAHQHNNTVLVQHDEDQTIYVNAYRIAAANNVDVWESQIWGMRLE